MSHQDLDGPNTGLRSARQALSTMPIIIPAAGAVVKKEKDNNNNNNAAAAAAAAANGNGKNGSKVSLVIIMAGTNDIGYYGFDKSNDDIAQSIIALHGTCFENGVPRTLAIAIPPSAYQSMNAQAATLLQGINQELQDYCQSQSSLHQGQQQNQRATYMSFPFDYSSRYIDHWSADGLHFSARGYQISNLG